MNNYVKSLKAFSISNPFYYVDETLEKDKLLEKMNEKDYDVIGIKSCDGKICR
ncbi:hypothetical protein JF818_14315, partial [Sphaerochaeta sp. S2]|nr:hypothetical protein [Sphaerochaeta sp. S2]